MTSLIYNTWGELKSGWQQVLVAADSDLCIFDRDLLRSDLNKAHTIAELKRIALKKPGNRIRFILKRITHLHSDFPLLVRFLDTFSHVAQIQQIPEYLQNLRDSLIIADSTHTLIRFDEDQPRCKLILSDPLLSKPYCKRFEEIWAEGGEKFTPRSLGL